MFNEILRWVVMIFGYLAGAFFGLLAILSIMGGMSGGFNGTGLMMIATYTIICVACFIMAERRRQRKSGSDFKAESRHRLRQIKDASKSCSQCGARLALCQVPEKPNSFPKLLAGDKAEEFALYCPQCRQYFGATEEHRDFVPPERPIPQGDGRVYGCSKRFLKTISSSRWLFTVGAAMCAVVTLWFGWLSLSTRDPLNYQFTLFFGVIAGGAAMLIYRCLQVEDRFKAITYEFSQDGEGLLLREEGKAFFVPWQSFRILSHAVLDERGLIQGIVCDTSDRVFTISANTENHLDLAAAIYRKVKDHVRVDSKTAAILKKGGANTHA